MALDYTGDKEKFKDFLNTYFTDGTGPDGGKDFKYCRKLTSIANREQVAITVDLDELTEFLGNDKDELVTKIENNAYRYTQLMAEAISETLPDHKTRDSAPKSALDIYLEHRLEAARQHDAAEEVVEGMETPSITARFPPELLRRFQVYWKPRSETELKKIRDLRGAMIGKLVSINGTVIRASEVRPLLRVATYSCDMCSAETFQPITGHTFMPLISCGSDFCKVNKAGGRLQLQSRGSKFMKFQELKVQELSSEVPAGHVPRQLTVHCSGENTRQATAGDHVAITGIFLPLPKSSAFAQISSGLLTDTYLDAHRIVPVSKWDEGEFGDELTDAELLEMTELDFYNKLAASIAPEVYGHEDVKKSLLLMLVGGVERNVGGLKIRGTINVCLMGDPGVAKSQLLSYIDRLAPRSQMTSGRGSSGVGLTASIMKDPVTGLMTLEAGALMLADQGVCCIDEFDKMNESDRTSLHEVMEQQTISIAKAGILTTLHARTSVLAAANPQYGRYNPHKSIQDNINLPAALLSRFDILWLLRDKSDQQEDLRLAKHITYVHQHCAEPPTAFKPMDMKLMRRYIIACRKKNPSIPESLSERLVEAYVALRIESRNKAQESTFTSPRSLLAILRLSTALARLRMADEVIEDDVAEAIRLVERSRDSLKPESHIFQRHHVSKMHQIHELIRRMRTGLRGEINSLPLKEIRTKCSAQGFSHQEVDRCLDHFEVANTWKVDRTKLTFIA